MQSCSYTRAVEDGIQTGIRQGLGYFGKASCRWRTLKDKKTGVGRGGWLL